MCLSSTHVGKTTWKQNKQSQKAFRRQNLQYSCKICLRLAVFVLNQVRFCLRSIQTYTTRTNMTFYTKKISEKKIIISTLDKYCAFIIVNFTLCFNKCTNRLHADSLSLNCILVVHVLEKTNTAYFYPLRKAEISISTYHDYSSGKEAEPSSCHADLWLAVQDNDNEE